MPKRKPKSEDQNVSIESLLAGKDASGRKFSSRKKQIKALTDQMKKLADVQKQLQKRTERATKGWKRYQSQSTKTLKTENRLLKTQVRHAHQMKRITQQLHKYRAAAVRADKANKSFALSLRKILRVGGLVGGLGLGLAIKNQIAKVVDARLQVFLSQGRGATSRINRMGSPTIAGVSKFELLNQFAGQGTSQFILSRQPGIQKGLLRAQKELSGLGTDVANRLLTDLSKSFGADAKRRRVFFQSVENQGVRASLQQYQSQSNYPEFRRTMNALDQPNDPTLQLKSEYAQTVESLKDAFEQLVLTVGKDLVPLIQKLTPHLQSLIQWLGKLTSGDLLKGLGLVGGGYLGLRVLGSSLGRKAALRGLGAGGRGAGALGRGGLALARGAPGAVAALPGVAASGGVLAGSILAAPVAIGGGIAIHQTAKTRKALSVALEGNERASRGAGHLDQLAKKLRAAATTELDAMRAERMRLDSLISGTQPQGTTSNWLLGPQQSGEYTPQQERRLSKLREQRRKLQGEITVLAKKYQAEEKALQAKEAETKAVKEAEKAAKKLAEAAKQAKMEAAIQKREELQMPRAIREQVAALAREELATARLSPFGSKLAVQEIQELNESLKAERATLQEILSTYDESDDLQKIEANKTRAQIAGISREIKANNIALKQAPLVLEQSETDVKRQQMALARISPYGMIGAAKELRAVNANLREEIQQLRKMAENSDLSLIEQHHLRSTILSREIEIKQNLRSLLDAYRDQALQQAAGSGRFSKILVNQNQALLRGHQAGMFAPTVPAEIVGNVDPKKKPLLPVTASQLLGHNPFEPMDKYLSPKNIKPVVMKGHEKIIEAIEKQTKKAPEVSKPVTQKEASRFFGLPSEKKKAEEEVRSLQRRADEAFGVGYTKDPSGTVFHPVDKIPRVGVSNPNKTRTLTHGVVGDTHIKGKKVREMMKEVGRLVEEISMDVDGLQDQHNNISSYGVGRLSMVQPA